MDLQANIQALLDGFVADGSERGAQVAVYRDGVLVVDAFAGVTDSAAGELVSARTLFPVFSTTKGITATLAHLMAERGLIDYDTPIARVWPEFAAQGKGAVTFGQALDHTAGVPNLPAEADRARIVDWDAMCALVAGLPPLTPPGARRDYHALTYSWTVGEVVRRVDGRPFSRIVQEEIADRLGVADELYCGLPDGEQARVATLTMNPPPPLTGPDPQPIPSHVQPLHDWMNQPAARRACVPGANGVMSARAVARHYAALLPGGVDGVELLPSERVRRATAVRPHGLAEDGSAQQALGYALGSFSPGSFGHGGYGGSSGWCDPVSRVAFGFTHNLFSPRDCQAPIYRELRRQLGS